MKTAMEVAMETAMSLYDVIPIKIILLVFAVLFCFVGYKVLRTFGAVCGLLLGAMVGVEITSFVRAPLSDIQSMILTVAVIVGLAIVCGLLFFIFYQCNIFVLSAAIGIAVVYLPALLGEKFFAIDIWIPLVIGALLFGATGLAFLRPTGILLTSLWGFVAAFVMTDVVNAVGWNTIVLGAVFTIIGCMVQFFTNPEDTLPWSWKKNDCEPDGKQQEQEMCSTEDDVTDETCLIDLSELPQEESDDIDSISDIVAAQIGLTECSCKPMVALDEEMFEHTESSDHPEITEDRTMFMPVQDVADEQYETNTSDEETIAEIEQSVEQTEQDTSQGDAQPDVDWVELHHEEKVETISDAAMELKPEEVAALEEKFALGQLEDEVAEEATEEAAENVVEQSASVDREKRHVSIKQSYKKGFIGAIILLVTAMISAGIGIYYAEIMLGLCAICVVFHWYRIAEFSCAVLCVRRIVDMIQMMLDEAMIWDVNHIFGIVLYALSAVVFLCLTIAIMCMASKHNQVEDEK